MIVLTLVLILGNFFVTSPSSSILRPSGNLFKSNIMLKERMVKFHTGAKEIAGIRNDKIAVLGYFHNPHVIFELMLTAPSYNAVKIGREDYRIQIDNREYYFIYFVVNKPEDMDEGADYILSKYHLHNHLFASATYDLQPLADRGLKTMNFNIIKKAGL